MQMYRNYEIKEDQNQNKYWVISRSGELMGGFYKIEEAKKYIDSIA